MSFAHRFSCSVGDSEEGRVRAVALDVHRDFCEVAIVAEGRLGSAGQIQTRPEALELFAQSLDARDWVALEVTGNAWEIARIIEPHVARVIVVSPSDTGIRHARAKTDRLDARTLAKLLAAGSLDSVWMPDERTRVMRRRLARRSQLVEARTRVKNEIHAILIRRLKGRPEVSDLFGRKGRAWLAELELPIEERETLDSGLRQRVCPMKCVWLGCATGPEGPERTPDDRYSGQRAGEDAVRAQATAPAAGQAERGAAAGAGGPPRGVVVA
jgi:hypothetical protein